MGVQFEIADDRRVQKRDGIGGGGIAEARMKFLGGRRAAHLRPALEHRDFEAGHREIGGGDEAVMPAADDNDVRHQGQRSSSGAIARSEERAFIGTACWRHLLPDGEGVPVTPHPSPERIPARTLVSRRAMARGGRPFSLGEKVGRRAG